MLIDLKEPEIINKTKPKTSLISYQLNAKGNNRTTIKRNPKRESYSEWNNVHKA